MHPAERLLAAATWPKIDGRRAKSGQSKGILDDSGADLQSTAPKPVRCVANEEIEP